MGILFHRDKSSDDKKRMINFFQNNMSSEKVK